MHSTSIKPLHPLDSKIISEMELQFQKSPWSEAMIKGALDHPGTLSFGFFQGDILGGYILAWAVADELQVHNILVSPHLRKQGIGFSLLHYVLEKARNLNLRKAYLEVRESNYCAIRLYTTAGFSSDGIRKKYYQDGENAVLMSLAL